MKTLDLLKLEYTDAEIEIMTDSERENTVSLIVDEIETAKAADKANELNN